MIELNQTVTEIKASMRIRHDRLDEDIRRNILICLEDLKRAGINSEIDTPLIRKACELYIKSQYDYCDKGAEFEEKYNRLRDAMSLSKLYKDDGDNDGTTE